MSRRALAIPAPRADPAWRHRLSWALLALLLLWPMLVATEFKPWALWDARSLASTLRFLADFFPPALAPGFLWLVLQETWRTVAMATVGICLGLVIAVPV